MENDNYVLFILAESWNCNNISCNPFQVKLYAELGKIEGSLQVLKNAKRSDDFGMYAIQVIELF